MFNGALDCELREYIIFDGDKKSFLAGGGKLKNGPAREERRGDRPERRGERPERRGDRGDRGRKPFKSFKGGERPERGAAPYPAAETPSDENPLAVRRNPAALRSLVGRKPSLPPSAEKPVMRSRGWKKKGDQ